jgi:cation:H+ antiporter
MFFVDFPLWQWGLLFAFSAAAVFGTSKWLVSATNTIGNHTGLSKGFLGAVMLATATSLPEIFTGISAVTLTDSPDLAVGTIFGSNLFNLLIIGILELTIVGPSLLSSISRPTKLSIVFSAILILMATFLLASLQSETEHPVIIQDLATTPLIVTYAAMLWLLHRAEAPAGFSPPANPSDMGGSLTKAIRLYALSTALIALASIGLSISGEHIGIHTGLSASFIGSLLIALSTSLPEVATSFAALRIGSPDMAISNMTGSNLFNTGIVLFTSDLAFRSARGGHLLPVVSRGHLLMASSSLLMTLIVARGAYFGSGNRKKYGSFTFGALILIALFLGTQYWAFAH